ncbi:ABC transporter ATP-binding protein/permease [Aliiroseovarius sp. S1339]|uniref:ABC transporter ATP-binding protein n=1 Tax=Aliiroseovarius sp. S1339 TaxID=2936990 RepID=UPI0020BF7255|nr:ABC transporter ATP-binding protein [Aliiroseovarius sp. S1339]MCK8463451.1 ABC transporter ATP-binding protein/permease [Aliiroseovarius sp. S1339]
MTGTLRKLWSLLTPRERRRGTLVLGLALIMAVFEVIGVASVFPFFLALSDPGLVQTNSYLSAAYQWGGFTDHHSFLLALALVTFAFLISGALIRSAGEYAMTRFVQMRRHSLGTRLITRYLRQPYAFFLGRHTGEMAKNILSEVEQVTMFALAPVLRLTTSLVTLMAMLGFLIVMDPIIAFAAMAILGTAYTLIFLTIRRLVTRNSARRVAADEARYTIAREALGGIKDIRVLGKEDAYIRHFRAPSIEVSRMQAANLVLGQVPKYLVEAIGFGGMLLLCVALLATLGPNASTAAILPKLGVYTFAGYRMLPSVQGIYRAMVELRFGAGAVDVLFNDMQALPDTTPQAGNVQPIRLTKALEVTNVSYSYDDTTRSLCDLSLTIPAGSSVGIVGSTGAGKTTLIDLLLGLLTPQSGRISVDGAPITAANVKGWQASIGYVPQSIFLADTTIAENIALGTPRAQIDMQRIAECARMAQLDHFVGTQLPDGYDTPTGESGVRLSGGQRQRIGIARALYHDPDILVFDEATSALDTTTEREVMKAIAGLQGQKTIVMIAHRISTVEACDKIVVLEEGRIAASGSYAQLIAKHDGFRALAGVAA